MTMSVPLKSQQIEELKSILSALGNIIEGVEGQHQSHDLQDIYQELELYIRSEE